MACDWVLLPPEGQVRRPHSAGSLRFRPVFGLLAGSSDIPSIAFYAGFLLYVVADRRLRGSVLFFLFPLPLAVVPVLAVNYAISGSVIPVQTIKSYFIYPGSPWAKPGAETLSGTEINQGAFLVSYAFQSLVGSRGFILYNPLLFIAIPLLVRELRPNRPIPCEVRGSRLVSALIVSYYLVFSAKLQRLGLQHPLVCAAASIVVLFYLSIHGAYYYRANSEYSGPLFAASTTIALVGLMNPWSNVSLSQYPLVANIKQILPHIQKMLGVQLIHSTTY